VSLDFPPRFSPRFSDFRIRTWKLAKMLAAKRICRWLVKRAIRRAEKVHAEPRRVDTTIASLGEFDGAK
jgi:hypothetical protein